MTWERFTTVHPVAIGEEETEYIEPQLIDRLCEHVPSLEWKTFLILARVAGLRVQSEGPLLKWGHVDWHRGRLTVVDQKRKTSRSVLLFPKVREVLEELDAAAEEGAEYILPAMRMRSGNWHTPLGKWADKAGITLPPAMFNAMRASVETDIAPYFGVHRASMWLGTSTRIAMRHYDLATDADHERAAGGANPSAGEQLTEQNGAICGARMSENGQDAEPDKSGQNRTAEPEMSGETLEIASSSLPRPIKNGACGDVPQAPSNGRYRTRTTMPKRWGNALCYAKRSTKRSSRLSRTCRRLSKPGPCSRMRLARR